jgi:lipopolysaccharide export system protein LptA
VRHAAIAIGLLALGLAAPDALAQRPPPVPTVPPAPSAPAVPPKPAEKKPTAAAPATPGAGPTNPLDFTGGNSQPIAVEADEGIEWRREEKLFIARGRATVEQGKTRIAADTLAAYYRETPQGKTEVYRFDAIGGVVITSETSKAVGDTGVYLMDKDMMVLRGKNLRIDSADQVITASDSIEYYVGKKQAIARGNANAARGDQRLRADVLVADLREDAKGKTAVRQINAFGNVLISTPSEIVRASRGVYDLESGLATLTGGVKITRGPNQLNGDTAQTNMKTGVSRIISTPGQGGRVRGLFMPESKPQAAATERPTPR